MVLLVLAAFCLAPLVLGNAETGINPPRCTAGESCSAPDTGDRGSILLQRGSLSGKVALQTEQEEAESPEEADAPEERLERRPETMDVVAHPREGPLPLCHESIVARTCADLNEGQDHMTTVALQQMQDIISLDDATSAKLWEALKLTEVGDSVPCQSLCEAVVGYAGENGVVPDFSDRACYTFDDNTKCDLDVAPQRLIEDVGEGQGGVPHDDYLVAGEGAALLQGTRQRILRAVHSSEEGLHTTAHVVEASSGDEADEYASEAEMREWMERKHCPFTIWEAAELIANFFRVFPSRGKGPIIDMPEASIAAALAQGESAATTSQKISSDNAEAKAWVSQVVLELANQRTAAYRSKWFGGSGSKSQSQVRSRIIKAFDFIKRELDEVRYVYPADSAYRSACSGGASAYVWKSSTSKSGYTETTGPLCSSGTSGMNSNCGVDKQGRFYVYLCQVWMNSAKSSRIATLIHEAAHHTGPTDHSYNTGTMQQMSQSKQIDNAANYEHFGKEVAHAAWGCSDKDPPNMPFQCSPGPCRCSGLAGFCSDATYGAAVKSQCPATCGACNGQKPSPTPSPPPPPPPPPVASCSEPTTKFTVTMGGADYSGTCTGFANNNGCKYTKIQNACPVTCGICSPSQSSDCYDDPNYSIYVKSLSASLTCNDWKMYQCWDEVKSHCPVSCSMCGR